MGPLPKTVAIDYAEAKAWARAHGDSSLSAQLRPSGYQFAHVGGAIVPFVAVRHAWVTAGPPIVPHGLDEVAQAEAVRAFAALAAQARGRAVFFGLSPSLATAAGLDSAPVGCEPIWVPQSWHLGPRKRRSIAAQLRRAGRAGVALQVAVAGSAQMGAPVAAQMAALTRAWRAHQAMPALAFVAALPADPVPGAIFVLAHVGKRLVGFASLLPYGPEGDLLVEHIVRTPGAPNGTAEALVDGAMAAAAEARSPRLSLGLMPLAGPLSPAGAVARRLGTAFYNFAGLETFKRKLMPDKVQGWTLAWPPPPGPAPGAHRRAAVAAAAWLALARAFAGGSLMAFGWRLLARGSRPLLMLLTFCLPAWTWGLTRLDTATWFPAPWVQWAWVAFDGALTVALAASLRWPRPWAYGMLAAVVAADSMVTALEAVFYPGPGHALGVVMHLVGIAAPALSARLLYGAWQRLR